MGTGIGCGDRVGIWGCDGVRGWEWFEGTETACGERDGIGGRGGGGTVTA